MFDRIKKFWKEWDFEKYLKNHNPEKSKAYDEFEKYIKPEVDEWEQKYKKYNSVLRMVTYSLITLIIVVIPLIHIAIWYW